MKNFRNQYFDTRTINNINNQIQNRLTGWEFQNQIDRLLDDAPSLTNEKRLEINEFLENSFNVLMETMPNANYYELQTKVYENAVEMYGLPTIVNFDMDKEYYHAHRELRNTIRYIENSIVALVTLKDLMQLHTKPRETLTLGKLLYGLQSHKLITIFDQEVAVSYQFNGKTVKKTEIKQMIGLTPKGLLLVTFFSNELDANAMYLKSKLNKKAELL